MNDQKCVPIICLNTGERFRSMAEAAAAAGVNRSSVLRAVRESRACNGRYYAEVPVAITTSEQLEHWRFGRLLSCISYTIGGNENASDNKLQSAEI